MLLLLFLTVGREGALLFDRLFTALDDDAGVSEGELLNEDILLLEGVDD